MAFPKMGVPPNPQLLVIYSIELTILGVPYFAKPSSGNFPEILPTSPVAALRRRAAEVFTMDRIRKQVQHLRGGATTGTGEPLWRTQW